MIPFINGNGTFTASAGHKKKVKNRKMPRYGINSPPFASPKLAGVLI